MKEDILGYPVTTKSKEECLSEIIQWIESGEKGKYFVCANAHALELARKDKIFDEAIKNADMVTPDGIGVVLASRILGGVIRKRITGSDIFLGLSEMLNQNGGFKVFFLGSTEQNLLKIKEKMAIDFPNIEVVGIYSPPFKQEFSIEDVELMVKVVNQAKPNVLWVGMTAPKQEKWIYRNKDKLDVKFIGPIGAVFDFYSGNKKRANPWFQKHGLEWLYRLLQEPKRLYRRSFVSHPKFILRIIIRKLRGKSSTSCSNLFKNEERRKK